MSCKYALISWPITSKTPNNFYVNLGEIYDKRIKENNRLLQEFHRDISSLYPFRCTINEGKVYCHNIEDFHPFQTKYRLTVKFRLVGNTKKHTVTLRTPVLYDISCMVPLFNKPYPNVKYNNKDIERVCIVMPNNNPIVRQKVLDTCLGLDVGTYFILIGDKHGRNLDSLSTLMCRYLLTRGVPYGKITKSSYDKDLDCIIEALTLLELIDTESEVSIACTGSDINPIMWYLKKLRLSGDLNKRITYICPFIDSESNYGL